MIFIETLSGVFTLRKIGGDCLFGHIFAPLSLNIVTNDSLNSYVNYTQGVEPFDFSGSGSVWVQQRFQISVQFWLRFK